MSDKTKSAAGRVLSELYREDQRRREEPPDKAPERAQPDGTEHDDDPGSQRAA
jgi:hypothetical protein